MKLQIDLTNFLVMIFFSYLRPLTKQAMQLDSYPYFNLIVFVVHIEFQFLLFGMERNFMTNFLVMSFFSQILTCVQVYQ